MDDRRYLGNLNLTLTIALDKPDCLKDKQQIKRLKKSIAKETMRIMDGKK